LLNLIHRLAVAGQEIANIRGNLSPIVRLHEFYGIEPSSTELMEGILVIVEYAGRRFCLFVDELIGQQQIVNKGLSEYIAHVKAISGCIILGDGTVCLIINRDLASWDVGVLAADISSDILETAKKGIYDDRKVSQLPDALKK